MTNIQKLEAWFTRYATTAQAYLARLTVLGIKPRGTVFNTAITTLAPTLVAPATFTAVNDGGDKAILTWAASAGAEGYVLEAGLEEDYSDAAVIYTGALLTFTTALALPVGVHYFRVKATGTTEITSAYKTASLEITA